MKVLVDGKLKHSWKISSGAKGHHTPTGSYKPYYMNSMHYSKKYDNAPMPHSVFYSGGFAVHATSSVRRLGTPASHGCTRLSPGNARKSFSSWCKNIKKLEPVSGFRARHQSHAASKSAMHEHHAHAALAGTIIRDMPATMSAIMPAVAPLPIRAASELAALQQERVVRRTSHGRIFNWQY